LSPPRGIATSNNYNYHNCIADHYVPGADYNNANSKSNYDAVATNNNHATPSADDSNDSDHSFSTAELAHTHIPTYTNTYTANALKLLDPLR